jgi:hypothetical protein
MIPFLRNLSSVTEEEIMKERIMLPDQHTRYICFRFFDECNEDIILTITIGLN